MAVSGFFKNWHLTKTNCRQLCSKTNTLPLSKQLYARPNRFDIIRIFHRTNCITHASVNKTKPRQLPLCCCACVECKTWQHGTPHGGVPSGPGGAERPVGCHLDASQLNFAVSGAEAGCTWPLVRRTVEPCESTTRASAKVSNRQRHACIDISTSEVTMNHVPSLKSV